MNPEVSVILPFYNAEDTLITATESILNQTFKNLELLLINNNSTDNSFSLIKELAKKNSRIRLLSEKKQGVAHAMNCGLKNARGKYLARMDADDLSLPTRIEKQVRFLSDNAEIDFIGSQAKYIPHNRNTDGFQRFVDWSNSFYNPKEIELNRFIEIPIINPTILFRKDIYNKFGGCLNGDFPEDYEMQLRYLQKGVKMAKLEEPLLEWHDYASRLTRTDERYSTQSFFETKAKFFVPWSQKNNPFHPNIWIWGAGRKTRQRAKYLENEGLKIDGYIDIVKSKTTQKTTIHFEEIPKPGEIFIVSLVTNNGAREQIRGHLLKAKYIEGEDFILMG